MFCSHPEGVPAPPRGAAAGERRPPARNDTYWKAVLAMPPKVLRWHEARSAMCPRGAGLHTLQGNPCTEAPVAGWSLGTTNGCQMQAQLQILPLCTCVRTPTRAAVETDSSVSTCKAGSRQGSDEHRGR